MALGNIFKKKKSSEEEKVIERPAQKLVEIVTPKVKKETKTDEVYRILKFPYVTEKASDLTKKNQYVFQIYPKANKVEVKKAIENLYGVDVLAVKIINIPPKRRRLGRISGWRKGYKKAIVRIKEGQKIEIIPH